MADSILVDDAGLRCLPAATVRELIDQRARQAEADRQRAAARQASMPDVGGQLRRRLAARAQAQRELLRENPDMPAQQVMALSAHEHDSNMARAGRRHDELITAQRRGEYGTMHRFTPQKG